jgi:PadR family transcriptional regulator AphA
VPAEASVVLLPGEWAVLAVFAEQPRHGFAVARLLAAEGELGRVWTMKRPRVYAAIDDLVRRGLLAEQGAAASERGPTRMILDVTPAGRAALAGWLAAPVQHVRDLRSELLLKLLLLERSGLDPRPLLSAQREVLSGGVARLQGMLDGAEGFDWVLARWRLESTRAALAFVEALLARA